MHLEEKHLETENIFDGIVVKLKRDTVLLEDGTKATREVIMHPGGVGILPLDDDNNVYECKMVYKGKAKMKKK